MAQRLALIISHLFDPVLVGLTTLFLVINATTLNNQEKLGWYTIVALTAFIPPVGLLLYERGAGKISDWFITNRNQRKDILLMALFSNLVLVAVTFLFSAPTLLYVFAVISLLINMVTYFITVYLNFKISVHAIATTVLVLVLLLIYSPNLWAGTGLIPVVAWARWRVKGHSLSELSSGVFLAVLVTLFVFKIFALV